MVKGKTHIMRLMTILAGMCLLLVACQTGTTVETEQPATSESTESEIEEGMVTEEQQDDSYMVALDEESNENPLPADPIAQTFSTTDGITLEGTFYPAATTDAPILVLMHWAPGDQSNWLAIAGWLQNRGLQQDLGTGGEPWMDTSWFPELYEDVSFNVFTFTFRCCEGGCKTFDREGWKLDVEAAMLHVISMDNVDLSKVLTVGASIGADGAAYGCHFYNSVFGGCQGAFSISPGGYLTVAYAEEVALLENELLPRPAWCLYSTGDSESAAACQNVQGQLYQSVVYEGSAHGMSLITPDTAPGILEKLLEFIERYLECDACAL